MTGKYRNVPGGARGAGAAGLRGSVPQESTTGLLLRPGDILDGMLWCWLRGVAGIGYEP